MQCLFDVFTHVHNDWPQILCRAYCLRKPGFRVDLELQKQFLVAIHIELLQLTN